MLDPTLLRTLVTISECGTFAGAAHRLHQTPSAISMQMKRLESEVNQPIFEVKKGRTVRFSKSGEMLIPYAYRILSLLQDAIVNIKDDHKEKEFVIGITEDYIELMLKDVVQKIRIIYPQKAIRVVMGASSELYDQAKIGIIDLSIVTGRNHWPDFHVLMQEPLVWVATSESNALTMTPLPIALFREGCVRRASVLKALTDNDVPYTIAYSSGTLSGLVAIARTGLALAPMARCCVPDDLSVVGEQRKLPALPYINIGAVYGSDAGLSADDRLAIEHAFRKGF